MVDGLYWETWYNNKAVEEDELGYIFYENKLLGVPRFRQLKVRDDSCTIHDDFKNEIKQCFGPYASSIEYKDLLPGHDGALNLTAYTYASDLEGGKHWGQISTYGPDGYVQNLGLSSVDSNDR